MSSSSSTSANTAASSSVSRSKTKTAKSQQVCSGEGAGSNSNVVCPQMKYQKPTLQLYRPPSARVESAFIDSPDSNHSSNASIQSCYSNDSRYQPNYSQSFGNVPTSNAFPIKGVLKRSKSFGNNNNSNNRKSGEFSSPSSLLGEGETGRFLLSLEGLSWENLTLIKQALDRETCALLDPCSLLKIVRILCNKVMEKPTNAKMISIIVMEIHQKQQLKMSSFSDHKYLFLESLASCLREWFNERDKLRFTTGGARRWTGYILFLVEMYLNLKSIDLTGSALRQKTAFTNYRSGGGGGGNDEESSDDSDYNCVDEEVSRAFSSEPSDPEDLAYVPRGEVSLMNLSRTSARQLPGQLDIEAKINHSVLSKQQKQFSNLLLDSCQVILSNPNSTPAEIECMQTAFRKCGSYLEEDNQSRLKALIFSVRDTLLNCGNGSQFINSSNSSNNSSITKNLLEIIELSASSWKFSQSQQIYYFPYTKMD